LIALLRGTYICQSTSLFEIYCGDRINIESHVRQIIIQVISQLFLSKELNRKIIVLDDANESMKSMCDNSLFIERRIRNGIFGTFYFCNIVLNVIIRILLTTRGARRAVLVFVYAPCLRKVAASSFSLRRPTERVVRNAVTRNAPR